MPQGHMRMALSGEMPGDAGALGGLLYRAICQMPWGGESGWNLMTRHENRERCRGRAARRAVWHTIRDLPRDRKACTGWMFSGRQIIHARTGIRRLCSIIYVPVQVISRLKARPPQQELFRPPAFFRPRALHVPRFREQLLSRTPSPLRAAWTSGTPPRRR